MQSLAGVVDSREHFAFMDVLASMKANDARWAPTMAGFVTLRLVDKWVQASRDWLAPRPSEVGAVRGAINALRADPLQNALIAVVDIITQSWGRRPTQASARLLAYGALLYDRNEWALSADVYRTFLVFASSEEEMDIAAYAWHRLGLCEHWIGRYVEAEQAQRAASDLAVLHEDRYIELAAHHGLALIVFRRGNLPEAAASFDAVIAECEKDLTRVPAVAGVLARALQDAGGVALHRGDMERAFALLTRGVREARDERHKERLIHDLAIAFIRRGLRSTARQALLVLDANARDVTLRWVASLNLLYLATLDGSELEFEQRRRALMKVPLPPRLGVDFQIYSGDGYRRFHRESQAQAAFARAVVLAERHSLNELLIEAEAKRDAAVTEPVVPTPERSELGMATLRAIDTIEEISATLVGAGA
jgi:tetratricopeptide (TPR) repeat protein